MSSDSLINYDELCNKAINTGYKVIAFTEHFDLLDTELLSYGLPSMSYYFKLIDEVRLKFPSLNIIRGIELGEPHRVREYAERLFSIISPDYIIGGLHITRTMKNVSLKITENFTNKDIVDYYQENLEMVEIGNFDTLGHLGIYRRKLMNQALPDEKVAYHIIDEIFRSMIKKNICLEINSSSFVNPILNTHMPEPTLLKRYKDLGGELITMSSDTHHLDFFDLYYKKALDSIKNIGFSYLYWKNKGVWERVKI